MLLFDSLISPRRKKNTLKIIYKFIYSSNIAKITHANMNRLSLLWFLPSVNKWFWRTRHTLSITIMPNALMFRDRHRFTCIRITNNNNGRWRRSELSAALGVSRAMKLLKVRIPQMDNWNKIIILVTETKWKVFGDEKWLAEKPNHSLHS